MPTTSSRSTRPIKLPPTTAKVLKTLGKINSYYALKTYGVNAQPYYVLQGRDGKPLVEPRGYDLDVDAFVQFLRSGVEAYRQQIVGCGIKRRRPTFEVGRPFVVCAAGSIVRYVAQPFIPSRCPACGRGAQRCAEMAVSGAKSSDDMSAAAKRTNCRTGLPATGRGRPCRRGAAAAYGHPRRAVPDGGWLMLSITCTVGR